MKLLKFEVTLFSLCFLFCIVTLGSTYNCKPFFTYLKFNNSSAIKINNFKKDNLASMLVIPGDMKAPIAPNDVNSCPQNNSNISLDVYQIDKGDNIEDIFNTTSNDFHIHSALMFGIYKVANQLKLAFGTFIPDKRISVSYGKGEPPYILGKNVFIQTSDPNKFQLKKWDIYLLGFKLANIKNQKVIEPYIIDLYSGQEDTFGYFSPSVTQYSLDDDNKYDLYALSDYAYMYYYPANKNIENITTPPQSEYSLNGSSILAIKTNGKYYGPTGLSSATQSQTEQKVVTSEKVNNSYLKYKRINFSLYYNPLAFGYFFWTSFNGDQYYQNNWESNQSNSEKIANDNFEVNIPYLESCTITGNNN